MLIIIIKNVICNGLIIFKTFESTHTQKYYNSKNLKKFQK